MRGARKLVVAALGPIVAFGGLATIAPTAGSKPTPTTVAPRRELMAGSVGFAASSTAPDVALAAPDGSGYTNVTQSIPGRQWEPAISPDGRLLAFRITDTEDRYADAEVMVTTIDGRDPAVVSSGIPGRKDNIRWSPDGTYLTFRTTTFDWSGPLGTANGRPIPNDGTKSIITVRPDGSALATIVSVEAFREGGVGAPIVRLDGPAIAPDGSALAWARFAPTGPRRGSLVLETARPDGSGLRTLVEANTPVGPAWTSRNEIVVPRVVGNSRVPMDLLVVAPDGSTTRSISLGDDVEIASTPVASPDGTRVAVHTRRGGRNALEVVHLDGSGSIDIGSSIPEEQLGVLLTPTWSPDGRTLVYNTTRLAADGSTPPTPVLVGSGFTLAVTDWRRLKTTVGTGTTPTTSRPAKKPVKKAGEGAPRR